MFLISRARPTPSTVGAAPTAEDSAGHNKKRIRMNEYPLTKVAEKIRHETCMSAVSSVKVVITTHPEQALTELKGRSSKNRSAFEAIGGGYAPEDLQVFPEQGVIVASSGSEDDEKYEFFSCNTISCIEFVNQG